MLVHETFQNTIQGEGFWVGSPCDFIRLYGCPVGCSWCDTGYSSPEEIKKIKYSDRTIADLVKETCSQKVIISGGEPLFARDLSFLVAALQEAGKMVHIETSGAAWQSTLPILSSWITLSPKEHISPKYKVQQNAWLYANEIKLIIDTGDEVNFYKDELETQKNIFLQPQWNNPNALEITMTLLQKYPKYRLSTQVHKYLNLK
jgi:7-carboxy-7-deazaguanine synthase